MNENIELDIRDGTIAEGKYHPPGGVKAGNIMTLLYKGANYPHSANGVGFLRITPEASVHHGERVNNLHARTPDYVMGIVNVHKGTTWPAIQASWKNREACPFELNHLIGRIDLTLKFLDMGIRKLQWVHPEAGLHPAWQGNLGDTIIKLSEEYAGSKGGPNNVGTEKGTE